MRKRVLIVEDDAAIQRMLAMALSEEGFEIVTAATRDLAYGECLTSEPDVILLDLHLAGGRDDEGAVFLRDYRARGGLARVLIVSGLNHAEALTEGLGVDAFIGKPFDLGHLMRAVRSDTAA